MAPAVPQSYPVALPILPTTPNAQFVRPLPARNASRNLSVRHGGDRMEGDALRAGKVPVSQVAFAQNDKGISDRNITAKPKEIRPPMETPGSLANDILIRHVRHIGIWVQVETCPDRYPDGYRIYESEIRPRIKAIRNLATSDRASFAVRFVAVMALIHIVYLMYAHMQNKICAQIVRRYEALAKDGDSGDDVTEAMRAVMGMVMEEDKEWLKNADGAAYVLKSELLEIQDMLRAVASKEVQSCSQEVYSTNFAFSRSTQALLEDKIDRNLSEC